ncbi:aspartic peptidase domain-containing protein [Mycena sp. CBHHK59/15]|nr:aspartic peptidase domain-containing protein [Mycena sp. CBHHK59/15]
MATLLSDTYSFNLTLRNDEQGDAYSTGLRYLDREPGLSEQYNSSLSTSLNVVHAPATAVPSSPPPMPAVYSQMSSWNSNPRAVPVHSEQGPQPLLTESTRQHHNFLTTTLRAKPKGRFAQVITELCIGSPSVARRQQTFPVEIDTGSGHLWVFGDSIRETADDDNYPSGIVDSPAVFWQDIKGNTSQPISDQVYPLFYAGGDVVRCKFWWDFILFAPSIPLEPTDPPPGIRMVFGVAEAVGEGFYNSPASGILGLGRKLNEDTQRPTFVQQLRKYLHTPEVTMLLGETKGSFVLGRRPTFRLPAGGKFGDWHENIPVVGNYWTVSSKTKTINGKTYPNAHGDASLDSGSTLCYVDDEFAEAFYKYIPGSYSDESRHKTWYLPIDSSANPEVFFEIGGATMRLQHFHIPGATPILGRGGRRFYHGAIQKKSTLFKFSDAQNMHAYTGPDILGRVLLINMQVVLQMPADGKDTISWRAKPSTFAG